MAVAAGLLAAALCPGAAAAAAAWEPAATGAVALAPAPKDGHGVDAVQISCAEQRWTLLLRTGAEAPVPAGASVVRLRIDRTDHELPATPSSRGVEARLPRDVLEPLKGGAGMEASVGEGEARLWAALSLKGSRKAIEAIAPLCSPRDMSAYELVVLAEDGPTAEDAAMLMREEIRRFRQVTGRPPSMSAALLVIEGGRRLLAVSLCGATSYFGESGCNLTLHAATPEAPGWREVYNTEGVALHLDRTRSVDGWPGLVTVAPGEDEPYQWAWDGEAYAPADS